MTNFLLRFVSAGLLVALLPLVAASLGSRLAGVVLLFPAVTLAGFVVLGLEGGTSAVAEASVGSLIALPAVLAFLLTVHLTARRQLPLPWVLSIALIAWSAAAATLANVTTREEA